MLQKLQAVIVRQALHCSHANMGLRVGEFTARANTCRVPGDKPEHFSALEWETPGVRNTGRKQPTFIGIYAGPRSRLCCLDLSRREASRSASRVGSGNL
jgi:hypothetical protein